MKNTILSVVLLLFCCFDGVAQTIVNATTIRLQSDQNLEIRKSIKEGRVISFDMKTVAKQASSRSGQWSFTLRSADVLDWNFDLEEINLISPNYNLELDGVQDISKPTARTFKGTLVDKPGSHVRLTICPGNHWLQVTPAGISSNAT